MGIYYLGLSLAGDWTYLADLPLVALVRVLGIILQGLWARELMVTGRGGTNVALPGDLAREAGNRARY